MRDLVLWGATGQAKVLAEFAERAGYRVVALIDRDPAVSPPLPDIPLYVGQDGFECFMRRRGSGPLWGLAAIGGMRGRDRVEIHGLFESRGITIPTLVHPEAYVARSARLGVGAQILARAVVGVDAEIGPATIVNTAASIDHDCRIGRGVHVAPGATVAGAVTVGDLSFIGPGAVLVARVRIGAESRIGAGSVVTRDMPDRVLAYGVPARICATNGPVSP
ncbi:MAG: sugar acetyltransferase [Bradyrhizobiaceae bacterium]|nr:MAG: sugar acetyltransferase [Bradyrhizobiaceae bacterium]